MGISVAAVLARSVYAGKGQRKGESWEEGERKSSKILRNTANLALQLCLLIANCKGIELALYWTAGHLHTAHTHVHICMPAAKQQLNCTHSNCKNSECIAMMSYTHQH